MVLEMKVPHGAELSALRPLVPVFFSYVLSFVMVGIYWNNHHHLLRATKQINGAVMWANLHLLFWLSLLPFVTGWMGENHGGSWPTMLYGVVMLMAAVAYTVLTRSIVSHQGQDSALAKALGNDLKGKMSLGMYLAALPLAFLNQWISDGLYIAVALMWLMPDRRIEGRVHE